MLMISLDTSADPVRGGYGCSVLDDQMVMPLFSNW